MDVWGTNIAVIGLAAVAGFMTGGIWYGALAKPWMEASGMTAERIAAARQGSNIPWPFIIALVGDVVMALVLAVVIGHMSGGSPTLWTGVMAGGLAWLGFVITTLATNHAFQEQPLKLTLIDGGHWLLVLLVEGAIIGALAS